jgi:hypothetical protein
MEYQNTIVSPAAGRRNAGSGGTSDRLLDGIQAIARRLLFSSIGIAPVDRDFLHELAREEHRYQMRALQRLIEIRAAASGRKTARRWRISFARSARSMCRRSRTHGLPAISRPPRRASTMWHGASLRMSPAKPPANALYSPRPGTAAGSRRTSTCCGLTSAAINTNAGRAPWQAPRHRRSKTTRGERYATRRAHRNPAADD